MKKILTILFLIVACAVKAQYTPNSGAYSYKGLMPLKSLQLPTGCGYPSTLINSPDSSRSAIYFDSCNADLYRFDPKPKTWSLIGGSTGGIDSIFITSTDSIFIINGNDTIFVGIDSGSVTLQQAFNNSVTAGDNPKIDANGGVFNIDDANNILLYATPTAPNNFASTEMLSRDAGFQKYGGFTSSYGATPDDTSMSASMFATNQLTQVGNSLQVSDSSVTLNQLYGGISADNTIQKFAHPPPIVGLTYYIPVSVNGQVADSTGNIVDTSGGGTGGIDSIFITTSDSIFIVTTNNDTLFVGIDSSANIDSIFITNSDSIFIINGNDTTFIGLANNAVDTIYSRNDSVFAVKDSEEFFVHTTTGGSGGSSVSLDTTLTADGSLVYDFDFPAEPWVYNDLPNLDSVRWASGVIYFHFAAAPVSPQLLHFQVVGGNGGSGEGGECIGCITQLQLNDSMAAVRTYIAVREAAIRSALADTAAAIRADIPTDGGGSGGVTDFSLTANNSGSGAASGSSFDGSSAITWSYNTFGAVPTARTITTTAPMTGGGNLGSNLTLGMSQASTSTNGWLSSTNWNTFNNKVPTGVITSSGLTMGSGVLLGRYSASTGAIQQITLGPNLELSGAGQLDVVGVGGGSGSTDFPVTFNTSGGAAPGTTFNGGAAITVSPTTIGAVSTGFTLSTTAPLTGGGNFTTNRTLSISQANTSTNGYLSSTDWNTFNGKLSNITGKITAGTDISISGAGTTASPYVINSTADGGSGSADLGLEYYSTYTPLTDGTTIDVDYDDGGNFSVTLGGTPRTFNFLNAKIGVPIYIRITQDVTGNRMPFFPANTKFVFGISDPGSHQLNTTTTGGAVDIICVVKDPTNYNVWMAKDMRF